MEAEGEEEESENEDTKRAKQEVNIDKKKLAKELKEIMA
jgi:hypothetical protein